MLNYMKESIERVNDFIYFINHINVTQWDDGCERED